MNDKVVERFASVRKPDQHLTGFAVTDESDTQDLGCFGVMRGASERAVMIECRKRDGNIMAFAYAWISRVEIDPSKGISLYAGEWEITIAGRNLNREVRPSLRLFEAITRHRVPWIREADDGEALQSIEPAIVIERIDWNARNR